MANSLKVNWADVSTLGEDTLTSSENFEQARRNFKDIINSLPECWEGDDADEFIGNCNTFLDNLEKDTLYFQALGTYFSHSSETYGRVVNENAEKMPQRHADACDPGFCFCGHSGFRGGCRVNPLGGCLG